MLEVPVVSDPHPDLTAFKAEVIRVGNEVAANHRLCGTYRTLLYDLGLSETPSVPTMLVEVSYIVQITDTKVLRVPVADLVEKTSEGQEAVVKEALAQHPSVRAFGENAVVKIHSLANSSTGDLVIVDGITFKADELTVVYQNHHWLHHFTTHPEWVDTGERYANAILCAVADGQRRSIDSTTVETRHAKYNHWCNTCVSAAERRGFYIERGDDALMNRAY